jgi:hypothetical protein
MNLLRVKYVSKTGKLYSSKLHILSECAVCNFSYMNCHGVYLWGTLTNCYKANHSAVRIISWFFIQKLPN